MPQAQTFPAEPDVLVWARRRAGLDIEDAATHLKLAVPDLQAFERGEREPAISLLERMATTYKTAFTSLLLFEPPALPEPPRDFRTFDGAPPEVTPELRFAFARTYEDREIATELANELEQPVEADIGTCRLDDDIARTAARERARLGLDSAAQLGTKNPYGHFRLWRAAVERMGVLVFARRFDPRSCRGFSSGGDGLTPAITVSSRDSPSARVFTVLHEYSHLMLGDPGMCSDPSTRSSGVEAFCNELAAAMLMPPDLIDEARLKNTGRLADSDAIRIAARRLRVSASAAAIRLATLGLITTKLKEEVLNADRHTGAEEDAKKHGGGYAPPARKTLNELGSRFTKLVFEGVDRELLDIVDADGLLDLAAPHHAELRQQIGLMDAQANEPR